MKQAELLTLLYNDQATGGWTQGMARITRAILARIPIHPADMVLEVGCGLGKVAHTLQDSHPAAHVTGVEIHPVALANAASHGRATFVQGNLLHLPFPAACAHLLLALDSFDQVGIDLHQALAEAHRVLRPNGLLLLRVSAHPRLQGAHDVAFNTGRRYTRAEIAAALAHAGYAIERTSYANALLAAPVAALRSLEHVRSINALPTQKSAGVYGSSIANAAIHKALALESAWLRRANLPLGLSLLVLARKQ